MSAMPSQSISRPPKYNLPTPEATPTKRSHVDAFGDESLMSAATSSKPFKSLPVPTKRRLFFNTPKWSIAYNGVDAASPIHPQPTRLLSPSVSVSPHSLAPPCPELQTLEDELAEALPSDTMPAPEASSPYGFRKPGPQVFPLMEIVDQDETGTYDPGVTEWEDEEDTEDEELSPSVVGDTEEGEDEVQVTSFGQVRRGRGKPDGVQLSTVEYERFLESLLEQVSFTQVDQHVASNRGRKVFRRVIKEMFRERIEDL